MTTMSSHVRTERLDRMTYIAMNMEFGNVILEYPMENKRECITDTGIILVKALHEDFLITAYVATMDKIVAMYHSLGYDYVPTPLYTKVNKNKIHVILQNLTEEERKVYLRKNKRRK